MTRSWPVWALLGGLSLPVFGQGLYLHVIPTDLPDGPPGDRGEPWSVEMEVNDVSSAAELMPSALTWEALPAAGDETASGRLRIAVEENLVLGGEPTPADRKASFSIDFHEPSVVALAERLLEASTPDELVSRPSIETLVRLTDESIGVKNSSRRRDIASRVARDGVGDCTEHAVLLVALARAFGYPARVIQGLVVSVLTDGTVEEGPRAGAFGHAWAEIHDGERWRTADATRLDREEGVDLRYLPLWAPKNEGPGRGMEALRYSVLMPKSVSLRRKVP